MNRNKMTILAVCAAMVVCASVLASFYASNVRSRPAPIVLPSPPGEAVSAPDDSSVWPLVSDVPRRLSLTKENVRGAVAALYRPSEYSAMLSVSLSYGGGTSDSTRRVLARSGYQHTYVASGLGAGRHVISGGGKSYRWDDGDAHFYMGESGKITPDDDLWIPTYEDIAGISENDILGIGYIDKKGYSCIFLSADVSGRTVDYWVSIDFGLLVASEIHDGEGALIYSMSLLSFDPDAPEYSDFTLPGGESVFSEGG